VELEPGRSLQHYRLIEKIGEGGMGVVWKAEDTTLDRTVAVKVLPGALSDDPDRLARFEREAKVLAQRNQPNIASIYGVGVERGVRFLAMELIEGENLSLRLSQGPLTVEDALHVGQQIADALEAAHAAGVIHRDLKPANVVLTPDGKAVVLDFGLSKSVEPRAGSSDDLSASPTVTSLGTIAGVILGTAGYMSPEQARGKPVDHRTDLWAFGCVMYESLTGRATFPGETATEVLGAILHRDPDFDALPTDVPLRLRRLVARCLRRDPRERQQHAGDARILLEEIMSGDGAADDATSHAPTRRRPRWWRVSLVVTALLAALGGAVVTRLVLPEPAEPPFRRFRIPLTHEDEAGAFTAVISPDGQRIVYVAEDRLWLRDMSDAESRSIPETEGARLPFWSPDAEWIGFARKNTIEKIKLAGGPPVRIGELPKGSQFGSTSSACWDDSGKVVISTGGGGLLQLPARGGAVAPLLDPVAGESDFHKVGALPDAKGWIFTVHRTDSGTDTLALLSAEGERKDLVVFDGWVGGRPVYSPSGHILFRGGQSVSGIWAVPFSLDRLEETGEAFLVTQGARDLSIARDGTLTYVVGGGTRRSRVVWVDRTGAVIQSIGDPLTGLLPLPTLSADESQLLMPFSDTGARELWTVDTATGFGRQLSFSEEGAWGGVWHPDGKRLLYVTRPSGGYFMIRTLWLDGSQPDRLLIENGMAPTLTQDGSTLVFARQSPLSFDHDIFMMPMDAPEGTEPEAIIDGPGYQWSPALSPDDRFLAYETWESGTREIWVNTFPPTDRGWKISSGGGAHPHWGAEGNRIYYDTEDAVMVAEVDPRTARPTKRPEKLFRRTTSGWSAEWWDSFEVSADEQRFVIFENIPDSDATPPAIIVTQNWFAELR
jgi:serine/threonine-protein kinase